MKYFKKFKSLDDFSNHNSKKNYFSMVEGQEGILLSKKDNSLTQVKDGKITLDTSNLVVSSQEMEGTFNAPTSDLYLLDSKVQGKKTSGNAKIATDDEKVVINNITVSSDKDNGIYNVFEQPQKPTEITKVYEASNVSVDGTNLKHNVFNIYNLQDNAVIKIKDCKFDLNMATSNVMRIANYQNAKNVSVIFENIDWTYENVGYDASDIDWAGVLLYQPASTDKTLTDDLSYLKTWEFKFINCTYNGEKVISNNTGEPNQVMYLYNIGKKGEVNSPEELELNIQFK